MDNICSKCNNVADQIINHTQYCKDHHKICSYEQCEQIATEYKYSDLARRDFLYVMTT